MLEIGRMTGLREEAGRYYPANFERGLLCEKSSAASDRNEFELGTGRGLGILCIADQVRSLQYPTELLTVDIIPPQSRQHWPIFLDGEFSSQFRSLEEVWSRGFPDLKALVTVRGPTTVLPALVKENRKFDFIFIDAAHDVHSVFHDFAYGVLLLAEEGEMLMDDLPMEAFGLGTCIVAAHARRVFSRVDAETSGLVFEEKSSSFTRGMVHLAGRRPGDYKLAPLAGSVSKSLAKLWKDFSILNPAASDPLTK